MIYAGDAGFSRCTGLVAAACGEATVPGYHNLYGPRCLSPDHKLFLDTLGMHGAKYANVAVNEADLVLALGVRSTTG